MSFTGAFTPAFGQGFSIVNAVASAAAVANQIPDNVSSLVVYNSSATAIAFFRVTSFPTNDVSGGAGAAVVGQDMCVPPATQIRVNVHVGTKQVRAIATAADGTLYFNPGMGL